MPVPEIKSGVVDLKVLELSAVQRFRSIRLGEGMRGLLVQLVTFGCGFLAADGAIFGSYAPFGISMVAAVPFPNVMSALTGAMIGYIFFPIGNSSFRYIASMLAVIAIRWTLNDIKALNRHFLYSSMAAFLPTFATGLAMMSVSGFSARMFSLYATESLLCGAAAYFISRTVVMLSGTRSLGMLMPQELACLILSGCIGILALAGITVGTLSVGRILSVLIILFFARYGGISGGAVAGISVGVVLGLSSAEFAFLGSAYAFGGLMAGLFSPVGRIAASLAFMMSAIVTGLQSGTAAEVIEVLYETIAAALIFLLVPKNAGNFLKSLFVSKNGDETAEGLRRSVIMRLEFASKALNNVSEDVEEVSRRLSEIVMPGMPSVYQDAVDNTCARCGMKVFCWVHRDGVSMESFDFVTKKLRTEGSIEAADFREDFRKKCCRTQEMAKAVNASYRQYLASEAAEKRIEEVRQVVAGQFCGLGDILGEMAEEYANYEVFDNEMAEQITMKLKELGLSPHAVSCRIDYMGRMSIEAETEDTDRRKIKRAVMVHELSKLCGRRFDAPEMSQAAGSLRLTLCERPGMDIEIAASQHISGDGKLCGDHFTYFTDGTGRFTTIISDGMGTGGRAAVDGGMASGIMERLLRAGLGYDCALKVVNSALLVKSGDESLATLDVVSLDLYSGKTQFMKAGAALSFIRKDHAMYRVETPSLPAGILPQIRFTYTEDDLNEGDVIVMVSDGVIASGEDWIERTISSWKDESMQQLADHIVDEACARRNDGHDDDMTVVAMYIKAA